MTFLNPFILLGLIAAGIPILLHLLNLRKLRTVEFSTLSFLKELQRTKIRRIKIRQWLLLLLRTLLVILIVMAFARPTLKGSFAGVFGEQAKTTSVFIVDDSQSMTMLDDGGERLQQATDAALRVVGLLKEGDEVFLLKLSDVAAASTAIAPTRNLGLVRSALTESKPSFRHSTIEDALRLSARLLSSSSNFNKEVFVFSDFQSGGVASHASAAQARENLFPESIRFYLVDSGKRNPGNLGIESLSIPNSIFEPGKAFTVQARVINAGESGVQNHIVSLFVNGERVAQKGIDVAGGASTNVDFTAVPKSGGIVEGMVELENDDLDFDNRRYFTLTIPERVQVLLVGASPDVQYIRLALGTREPSPGTALQVRETVPERLSAHDVGSADVIILAGPRALSAVQAGVVESFLRRGGGLLVFPGQQTQKDAYNTGIAEPIGLPPIARVETLQSPDSETDSFLSFDRVELQHPLFRGMFEENRPAAQTGRASQEQRPVESPRITRLVHYSLPAGARSIITLSNRSPFLAEATVHGGLVLLCNVAALPEWSDFPLKGLFVPLLHRSVSYLAQGSLQQQELLVGEEHTVRSRARATERWVVSSPSNIETVVQPSGSGTESIIPITGTNEPGIYEVRAGASIAQKFAVNMHPDESKTAHIDEADLETMLERLGISGQSVLHVEPGEGIQQQVLEARFGVELWKHFLLAALVVAFVEMFVARNSKQELASVQTAHP